MTKPVTKKTILKLLRKDQKHFSKNPNSWRVLQFQKFDFKEDNPFNEPIDFEIEVSFQFHNYCSLIRDIYNADKYGRIREKSFENSEFSLIPNIKILINQLIDNKYITIEKQKINYDSEYGKTIEYTEYGAEEKYINAEKYFSKDEKEALETSIILTTKGQSKIDFWTEKLFSEPIGLLSLFISLISLIISLFK